LYHNGESQYIPTQFYIRPDEINRAGEILPGNPEADFYNYELGSIIQSYRKAILQIGSSKLSQKHKQIHIKNKKR